MPRARETQTQSSHEYFGLALLAAGTLLFLALISYAPVDVPTWFPLKDFAKTSRTTSNFIGSFGAILACSLYTFLGAAAYLVSAVLLGYGGVKLLAPKLPLRSRWFWCVVFIITGACLAELAPWALIDADRLRLKSEGGYIGLWLGRNVLRQFFGGFGSAVVLIGLYASSLLMLTGIRGSELLQAISNLRADVTDRYNGWREELDDRAERREQAQMEAERASRERRKAERTATRVKSPAPDPIPSRPARTADPAEAPLQSAEAESDATPEPQEPPRPAPKIFDSTAPMPVRRKDKVDKLAPLTPYSCENYELPSLDLLDPMDMENRQAADPEELRSVQDTVIDTLAQFGIDVAPGDITRGPTITRYEVYPAKGVRVDRIVSLERDIARATRAERINILAPIPGKDTVGIEIANSKKQKVTLRELLESDDFQNTKAKIPLALGKDVYGKTIIGDLAAMPHGLVAGTTGSGKSVCINSIIASILYRFSPEDLRFIMIDPKVVEMQVYNTLPHLVVPVVTDPKKVLLALRWAIDEMEKRYAIFAKTGVRNIATFNSRPLPKSQKELDAEKEQNELVKLEAITDSTLDPSEEQPEESAEEETAPESLSSEERVTKMTTVRVPRDSDLIIPDRMPYIVIIVDELADLMQTAPADVESAIARITQKARAAGIHMIIATQTPRADVITGVIKANVPCRVAFQVASALDSRVILDENGAERLLGQGDMLYRPPGTSRMIRAQGVLVTDEEIRQVVEFASSQGQPAFESSIHDRLQGGGGGDEEEVSDEDEELVEKCLEVMRQEKKASTSLFQRRLRLGYTRAARILDILETRGYVGQGEGAKPREILVDLDAMDV
ncbi:DNA translocase FtsK 4TM domain-containing protein [Verrucomicrobiota bacterium sgz303538]